MKIALDPYMLRRVLFARPGCRSARHLAKYGGAG
jgi:hypothetical protein